MRSGCVRTTSIRPPERVTNPGLAPRGWGRRPLDAEAGIYARNLAILKRTPGPVVLVEGPCLSNAAESDRLHRRTVEVEGLRVPRRVIEYADALFEALRSQASSLRAWGQSGSTP